MLMVNVGDGPHDAWLTVLMVNVGDWPHDAWLTVLMLKSAMRNAGMAVRVK